MSDLGHAFVELILVVKGLEQIQSCLESLVDFVGCSNRYVFSEPMMYGIFTFVDSFH